ncbi:MAG: protein phosphatase 2C domain-containing protein [Acidimicrobiales bacterium]
MTRRRRWAHASLTVTGSSHLRTGAPGADSAGSVAVGREEVILVVADGAGRSCVGHQAAALAVELALDAASRCQGLGTNAAPAERVAAVDDLCSEVVGRFLTEAATRDTDSNLPRDPTNRMGPSGSKDRSDVAGGRSWDTTLALAWVSPQAVACAAIGDGFLVGTDRSGGAHLLMAPRAPGAMANETSFVSVSAQPRLRVIWDPDLVGLVLSTDGLEPFLEAHQRSTASPETDAGGHGGGPGSHGGQPAPAPGGEHEASAARGGVRVDGRLAIEIRPAPEMFANLVEDLRRGASPDQVAAVLATADVQSRKGDDIGLALAFR